MVGAGNAQSRVILPEISSVGSVQVAVKHERRPIALASHYADDVCPAFLDFLEIRLDAGVAHAGMKKTRALQFLTFGTWNIYQLFDEIDRFTLIECINN